MAETNAVVVSSPSLSIYCFGFPKFNFLMRILDILIVISSLSFSIYGIAYFTSPHMKSEFIRFGLAKFGILTAVLEILGAIGLLVGFLNNFVLMISSVGLSLLMFFGFLARLRVKDSFWVSLPALFYMGLNAIIFSMAIQLK
jgi:hypothetical protein